MWSRARVNGGCGQEEGLMQMCDVSQEGVRIESTPGGEMARPLPHPLLCESEGLDAIPALTFD